MKVATNRFFFGRPGAVLANGCAGAQQDRARRRRKMADCKVNTENAQNLARRSRVNAIPTMALFKNGVEVGRQVGALAAPCIRKFLEPHVRNGGA
jgi:thioredoxin-like negative regulator of GroEL